MNLLDILIFALFWLLGYCTRTVGEELKGADAKFVVNTTDPEKDTYKFVIDDLAILEQKDKIIVSIVKEDKNE